MQQIVAIPMLALDACLSHNVHKRTRNVSSWPDYRLRPRGLVFIRSKYIYDEARNQIHARSGETEEMTEVRKSTVVTGYTLLHNKSNKSKCCLALPGVWVPAYAGNHAESLYIYLFFLFIGQELGQ